MSSKPISFPANVPNPGWPYSRSFQVMALAAALNRSFASPMSDFDYPAAQKTGSEGLLLRVYDCISGFSVFVTLILVLVAYDQCKHVPLSEPLALL